MFTRKIATDSSICQPSASMPGVFADRSGLVSAVAAWDANSTAAEVTHGHISGWDVSRVGDMSGSKGCVGDNRGE